jgi:hypothetical protein
VSVEQRYVPRDECPLFSARLEEHIVRFTRGELPNRGRFCGNCYTPMSPETSTCPHCDERADGPSPPVDQIPQEVIWMLREQRKTESTIVNAFAYAGFIIVILVGLAIVLGIPYLRAHLLPATIVYGLFLLIGGRTLAGVLGGYYGDRIAYDRARTRLRQRWADWVEQRARPYEA